MHKPDPEQHPASPATIAFVFWLLPIPIITLWTIWKMSEPYNSNSGYILPALALGSLLATTIAALVVGALTRTAGASFLGVLVSLPVAFAVGALVIKLAESKPASSSPQKRSGPKYTELASMIPALLGTDQASIARAIRERESFTIPWMMCMLAHDVDGVDGKPSGKADGSGPNEGFAVSTPALLQITDAVVGLDLAPEVEQVSLALAFQGMAKRDGLAYLPTWTALWDKAHQSTNGSTIVLDTRYSEEEAGCDWESTRQLADDLITAWGDIGINAWIATGHTFVQEQRTLVLHAATEPATLENIVASGAKIGPSHPPADEPEAQWDPLFASYAEILEKMVFSSDKPQRAVDLLAAYRKLVPDSPQRRDDMRTACALFALAKAKAEPGLPERDQAVMAYERLVCSARP